MVDAKLDHFKLAGDDGSRRAVFHVLDGGDDVAVLVALDGYLHVVGAGEGCVSARTVAGDAAVMDEQHEAAKRGADGVGGTDELGQVFGGIFVALERPVQGIDDDDIWRRKALTGTKFAASKVKRVRARPSTTR